MHYQDHTRTQALQSKQGNDNITITGKGRLPFAHTTNLQKGLIRTIVIVIAGILVLSYFGFNIRQIAESDTSRENFSYVQEKMIYVWDNFLETPVTFVWERVIIDLGWEPFMKALEYADTHSRPD